MTTPTFAPGTPSWVELGTTDPAAASSYYGKLFGWTTEHLGPEAGEYALLRLDGRQVGGVGSLMNPEQPPSWSVYLATDDAETTAERVIANGGRVVLSPLDVMDEGRMAIFIDPTGALFSVWEPGHTSGAEVVNEPGSLTWVELQTDDLNQAKDFYPAVFPIDMHDVERSNGRRYTVLETGGETVAGAVPIPDELGPSHWDAYFAVEDCDATTARAVELGGAQLTREDREAGRIALLSDPQGATFAVIERRT